MRTTSLLAPYLTSSQRAYTLVELMVVVAIIGLLSGIAYSGLSSGNKAETTRSAAFDLRNAIRNAAEQALTSKLNSAGVPADHYGVQVVSQSIYQIIRVEKCQTLTQATPVSTIDMPTGVAISTSPSSLKSVTFKKNTAVPNFWDGSGNPLSPNADGSVTLTVSGVGVYPIKIFQSTGRIE